MNRRNFILSAAAAPALAAFAPEFEITRPDPYGELEVLRRDCLLRWPWQVRAVRWIRGVEYEWVALLDHEPAEEDFSWLRGMFEEAYERTRARVG